MKVEIPSFYKGKCQEQFHAISDGFAALEKNGVMVSEIRLNSIDMEILKNDPDFESQSMLIDGRIAIWTAFVEEDDDIDCVRLSGDLI